LQSAGVIIAIGAKGSVADAIQQYKNGELEVAQEADVEGHWV
jgi:predicted Fe-Mo cluster-binding NifX family protein